VTGPLGEPSGFSLQQLPLEHELSSSSLHRGWVGVTTAPSSPYMQVAPLMDGTTAAAAEGAAAWQQQGLVPGGRGSSPHGAALYAAAGGAGAMSGFKGAAAAAEGGKMSGSKAAADSGLGLLGQQQGQHRLVGGSCPGDEAARLPDQNPAGHGAAEAAGAALMVSLEGWASSPGRHGRTPAAADATMVGGGRGGGWQ
jgi:hypothetical protein